MVPDPLHHYFFRYQPSAFTNDQLTLEFSPEGFLRRVSTVIEDQTGEFIKRIGELGSTLATSLGTTRELAPAEVKDLFNGQIDPFDEKVMEAINKGLQQQVGGMTLSARMLGVEVSATEGPQSNASGIYYKPLGTCELTLSYDGGSTSTTARIPHPHLLGFITIPQGAWVKNTFEVTFDETGMPATINLQKPSTALAAVEVPINILKAIIAIPTQLIQLRVNLQNTRQQALTDQLAADKKMAEIESELDTYRKEQQATNAAKVRGGIPGAHSGTDTRSLEDASQGDATVNNGELEERLKTLEQDLLVLRRRMNTPE